MQYFCFLSGTDPLVDTCSLMPRPKTSTQTVRQFKRKEKLRKKEVSVRNYVCRFCQKSFTTSGSLRVHERIHTGDRAFQCRFCEKSFTTSGNMRVHERIHTGDRPFRCRFCVKSFTASSRLRVHERIHTGDRPFVCRFCQKSFMKSGHQQEHERIHTGAVSYTHLTLPTILLV